MMSACHSLLAMVVSCEIHVSIPRYVSCLHEQHGAAHARFARGNAEMMLHATFNVSVEIV